MLVRPAGSASHPVSERGSGAGPDSQSPTFGVNAGALRRVLTRWGAGALTHLLGAADGQAVGAMTLRELSLILRSREWRRFVGEWMVFAAGVFLVPILIRSYLGQWRHPTGPEWLTICGYTLQASVALAMCTWTNHRLSRDLASDRMDELLMTRCTPADIAMGEALASAVASCWLVAATFPLLLLLSALGGRGVATAVEIDLSLAPAAGLGVWFGMAWGLAYTVRRPSAAISPFTEWWAKGPGAPVYVAWCLLLLLPAVWGVLAFIPGGLLVLQHVVLAIRWVILQLLWHWNPLLTVGAASGLWGGSWLTDWLVLAFFLVFMMRTSMDAVHRALAMLPERDPRKAGSEHWIHHDVHYFTQYQMENAPRREPVYRPGGNPIAAFDVALGHRVFLHPFLWCLAILAYLFLVGWSLLVPNLALGTATAAVLIPATGALLLMSGGVAVSFGWERDRHRWPALAVLPIDDISLATGKIKGVVRPTLWIALVASLTALFLGWRGALPRETSLWMALHVMTFPVALAVVSATLALTTPTVAEATYRWAVLGAIPAIATLLPAPIGGTGGLALPFSPPLLVLILMMQGAHPDPNLIRGAWISLGLQVVGTAGSLLVLKLFLRRWTVGEKD